MYLQIESAFKLHQQRYPGGRRQREPITLTVNVAADAPAHVTNSVTVSGGGDANAANNSADDITAIMPPERRPCKKKVFLLHYQSETAFEGHGTY
jgi:hypothetical protein